MNLPKPFDTFRLEKNTGEYKDFHVAEDDPYPLKGVTYAADYGDIEGYTGEDQHPLDVFVGKGKLLGFFTVYRPDAEGEEEHKFYLNFTDDEEQATLHSFSPVLRRHGRFNSIDELVSAMSPFKDEDHS